MSFDWNNFLLYARSLDKDGLDECCYRAGVSRAYYAAFHSAKEYLQKKSIKLEEYDHNGDKLGMHEKIWLTMQRQTSVDIRKIGSDGNTLKAERTTADYKNEKCIDRKSLIKVCKKAEEIVAFCN